MKGKDRNKKYIYIQMLCLGLGPASLINLDFSILVRKSERVMWFTFECTLHHHLFNYTTNGAGGPQVLLQVYI